MQFKDTHNKRLALKKEVHLILNASSFFFCLGFIYFIYWLFQNYDFGHPLTKFFCFSGLFILILTLYRRRHQQYIPTKSLYTAEAIFAATFLVLIFLRILPPYSEFIFLSPVGDIGQTTEHASRMLFIEGKNPYLSQQINVRPELAPEHRGFHYGPAMLLGYAPSAFFPGVGYKLTTLIYLAITALSLCLLVASNIRSRDKWQVLSTMLIALLFFFLPDHFWYEIFKSGANDIFPVSLLLLGLVCVQKEKWLWAGILMGLSFSAKFSPAAFLLAIFLRKDIRISFLIGCVIGMLPLFTFLFWDYESLIENVFILRIIIDYDSTSLYSITPPVLHVLFPFIQLSALIYLLVRNAGKSLNIEETVVCFVLLLIIIEITYKEVHLNHLIWFYPFIAFIIASYRHKLFQQSQLYGRTPILKIIS